ncbi:hypothetical protein B0H13DRAFT_2381596 [Mycena leptocephala]|nr:hypothetical protein B0H13DRAFT_2381596 [Mycena leptocephala]
MTTLPNAGIPAPIPDSFDFDSWMKPPPAKDPTVRTLRIRNRHNVTAEKTNEVSIDQTLNCRDERLKYPDVGVPLGFFYGYTPDYITDMICSVTYCTDVGPIPAFIRAEVERARRKKSERTEADKNEKTKGCPLKGAMVLSHPIVRVAGQREAVKINHQLHDLYTKFLRPEPTLDIASPDWVLVFDMQKMTQDVEWGSDELSSCLSPLKWQQAAANMEIALTTLSEEITVVAGVTSKPTFVSEFKKHRLFINYDKFEENYADWYPFEREARTRSYVAPSLTAATTYIKSTLQKQGSGSSSSSSSFRGDLPPSPLEGTTLPFGMDLTAIPGVISRLALPAKAAIGHTTPPPSTPAAPAARNTGLNPGIPTAPAAHNPADGNFNVHTLPPLLSELSVHPTLNYTDFSALIHWCPRPFSASAEDVEIFERVVHPYSSSAFSLLLKKYHLHVSYPFACA